MGEFFNFVRNGKKKINCRMHLPLVDMINIYHYSYCSMNRRAAELATETACILFQSFDRRVLGDPTNDYCAVDAVVFVCSLQNSPRKTKAIEQKAEKNNLHRFTHECNGDFLFITHHFGWMPNELICHSGYHYLTSQFSRHSRCECTFDRVKKYEIN